MPDGNAEVYRLPGHRLEDLALRMKTDWNKRAQHNAKWFINTVGVNQSEREFDQTGEREVEWLIKADLDILSSGRDPGSLRMLEIGSGIGRMTRFLAGIFGEVHAVDISQQMIARAKHRLRGLSNVFLQETNGIDFRTFPSDYFDLIFCAYVFQHVPDRAAIRSNIEDAYRVLKPGGVFKFQTNGVNNPVFNGTPKDTWVGDTFSESEIRSLAKRIGAGLVSVAGAGTQYCWSVWRKPDRDIPNPMAGTMPRILIARQQGETRDPEALNHLVMLVDRLDLNSADANSLKFRINGIDLMPFYAGPARRLSLTKNAGIWETASSNGGTRAAQIEAILPDNIETGWVSVSLLLGDKEIAGPIVLDLKTPRSRKLRIALIINTKDNGRDIYSRGSKSYIRIFFEGLTEPHLKEVQVLFGEFAVPASQPVFFPGNGLYMLETRIPEGIESGMVPVCVRVDGVFSEKEMMSLQKGADPAEGPLYKALMRVRKRLSIFAWNIWRYRNHVRTER